MYMHSIMQNRENYKICLVLAVITINRYSFYILTRNNKKIVSMVNPRKDDQNSWKKVIFFK